MKTCIKILTAVSYNSENKCNAVGKQELIDNIDKAFRFYSDAHKFHINSMTQSVITRYFHCHSALAQAQAQRDNDTVSECDLEGFLSEVEQEFGAASNTRSDARYSDRSEDCASDPDDPPCWGGPVGF